MTDNSSLFQFSLQERALHELAKACWGDYSTSFPRFQFDDEEEFFAVESAKLIDHRKKVVNIIHRIFTRLPKLIRSELIDAVVLVQRGYREALICACIYRNEIIRMKLFPLSLGRYAAKNFIDPTGCFDEINWAKRFISDESQPVFRRFDLACFYCFEDIIKELWATIKKSRRSAYKGSIFYVENRYGYMVSLWTYRLEDKFVTPEAFHCDGFTEAFDRGIEHAARFFWNLCSVTEREELMNEREEFNMTRINIFTKEFEVRHEGFVQFYYSLLSLEQKQELVSLSVPLGPYFLWSSLVVSRSYEIVLKDIQTIPLPTSSQTYAYVLNELTHKMIELPIPLYEEIFQVLWKPLSRRRVRRILGLGLNIISNLTEVNSMELLRIVIEPLGRAEKERMLIDNWLSAGVSAVVRFLTIGDFDGLRRYLLFFLMDRDQVTQKLSLRSDAIVFLNRFTRTCLRVSLRIEVTRYAMNKFNNVIDSIEGSLLVLQDLPALVDYIMSN